jgi:hypothetical protein
MQGIDEAWEKVFAKQARYRYVIDMNAWQRLRLTSRRLNFSGDRSNYSACYV